MNALLSIWTWLEIALMSVVGFCAQLVLAVFTWPFDRRRLFTGRCFRLVAVVSTKLTPYWDFAVHGALPQPLPRRTVVVSNHESNADPFLISHLPWEMKWLGKAELFRIPFIGWSMFLAGDVPVVRGEKTSGAGALLKCAEWVKKGMPAMIFPEGTRSLDGKMGPFKDGAFRLAVETGAEVLPLAVAGTHEALPKRSWKFGKSRGRVVAGTPIQSAGKSVEALRDEAREAIARLAAEAERAAREG